MNENIEPRRPLIYQVSRPTFPRVETSFSLNSWRWDVTWHLIGYTHIVVYIQPPPSSRDGLQHLILFPISHPIDFFFFPFVYYISYYLIRMLTRLNVVRSGQSEAKEKRTCSSFRWKRVEELGPPPKPSSAAGAPSPSRGSGNNCWPS